jgi:hypothetical protein
MTIPPGIDEDAARDTFSKGFEEALKNYQGTRYHLGAKSGGRSGIDCSGFVYKGLADSFHKLKAEGVTINPEILCQLDSCSEDQVEELSKKTGGGLTGRGSDFLAGGKSSSALKAGMVIGVSSGIKRDWSKGRPLKIDHVVCTYKDSETGELMVAESSGKKGVHASKLADWLKKRGNEKLYVVDPVGLAAGGPAANGAASRTAAIPGDSTVTASSGLSGGDDTATASASFNQNAGPNNMFGILMLIVMGAAMEASSPGSPLTSAPRPQAASPTAS